MAYNKRKIENWADIQGEQLSIQIAELDAEMKELYRQSALAKDFLEKIDIRKKAEEKKKQLIHLQESFHKKMSGIQEEAAKEIEDFNKQFDIQPFLLINIVLKF